MTDRRHLDTSTRLLLSFAFLALLVPSVLSAGNVEGEKPILELLRSSDIVLHGRVEEVIPPGPDRVCTAHIRIKETIKGETKARNLWVAEELLFPSDQPSYHKGKHVLLFLVDLPAYSRWKEYRARGIDYTTSGREHGVKELDPKAAGEAAAFLRQYQELASFRTQDEKRKYLEFLFQGLGSRVELVQEASVEAMVRLNDLRVLINKEEEELLDRFLRDKSKSRTARLRLIRTLLAWEGFEESVAAVLEGEPEMRFSILKDLETSGAGKRFDDSVLRACLKDSDPLVRTKALALVPEAADPAMTTLVGDMAATDDSPEVRARAITAAGKLTGEERREILLRGLEDPSPLVVYTAADEMRKLGGEASARELGGLLQAEDPKVRFIGILMLATMEEEEARAILEDASKRHPDEPTREWATKILSGGRLDANSMHQALGVEGEP